MGVTGRLAPRWRLLMIGLVALVGLLNLVAGEKIFVRGGLGWDGQFLGGVARDFEGQVLARQVDEYRLQRVLPSAIVHYTLVAAHLPLDNARIIRAFELWNLALLIASAWLWTRLAGRLGLSWRGRWLGFVGLFVNVAVLKQAFYYPVSTDVWALFLGLAMLDAHLAGAVARLFFLTVAGAFIWPVAWLAGAILLTLRRGGAPSPSGRDGPLATVVAATLTGFLLALLAYLYYWRNRRTAGFGPAIPIVEPLFYVSALVFAAYVFLTTRSLLRGVDLPYLAQVLRSVRVPDVVLAAFAVALPRAIIHALAAPGEEFLTPRSFLAYLVVYPATRPAVFFVSHVVYLGPIVLLIALFWRRFCDAVRSYGPAMVFFILLGIGLSCTSESRQSMLDFPAFVTLMAVAADDLDWSPSVVWTVSLIGLALSKFWLPIHAVLPEGRATDLALPLYFINHGPWMPNLAYAIQGALVAVLGVILYRLTRTPASGANPIAV